MLSVQKPTPQSSPLVPPEIQIEILRYATDDFLSIFRADPNGCQKIQDEEFLNLRRVNRAFDTIIRSEHPEVMLAWSERVIKSGVKYIRTRIDPNRSDPAAYPQLVQRFKAVLAPILEKFVHIRLPLGFIVDMGYIANNTSQLGSQVQAVLFELLTPRTDIKTLHLSFRYKYWHVCSYTNTDYPKTAIDSAIEALDHITTQPCASAPKLQIDFSNMQPTKPQIQRLAEILNKSGAPLEVLCFNECQLNLEKIKPLANARILEKVKTLSLANNALDDESFNLLYSALQGNTQLREIDISGNNMSAASMRKLAELIEHKKIDRMRFLGQWINTVAPHFLYALIDKKIQIRVLDMTDCLRSLRIMTEGDEVMKALSTLVECKPHISEIILDKHMPYRSLTPLLHTQSATFLDLVRSTIAKTLQHNFPKSGVERDALIRELKEGKTVGDLSDILRRCSAQAASAQLA